MLYMNWTYDWSHLSYSSIFFFFFFSSSEHSCLWVSARVDLLLWWRTCCTPLDWGSVGAPTCWSLAGIFPLVSLLHLLLEKWQLPVLGGPVHMPTLALGWTRRASHGCWGPFLFSQPLNITNMSVLWQRKLWPAVESYFSLSSCKTLRKM